jgi:tRNA(Ile)-lysidine synthase
MLKKTCGEIVKIKVAEIMLPLEYETRRLISRMALLPRGSRVVLGVSGGADSMALLLVLAALRHEFELELTAVYVDHGLRPAEARAEASLVAEQAGALGVDFRGGSIPVRDRAEQTGQSLEATGRELRYGFLQQVARELGGAVVAVAHQADDQAEELLLRLIRGSGRAGLAGMPWVNAAGVIRPFLGFTKERLRDYLRERGVRWLEDSSNADRRFLRNRVRLELLPMLEARFNPGVRESLRRTVEILDSEEELLIAMARQAFDRILVVEPDRAGVEPARDLRLTVDVLSREPLALQRRVMEMALVRLGAPASFQAIADLLALAGRTGGELHLSGGLRVARQGELLRFHYPAGPVRGRGRLAVAASQPFAQVIPGPGRWPLAAPGMAILVESLEQPPAAEQLRAGQADYLDAATVGFPLLARSVRPGDRFHPLGGPGRRKVSDFLTDRKVPRRQRGKVVVLESGGEICGLLGLRIDQRCRLTASTGPVLKVSLAP